MNIMYISFADDEFLGGIFTEASSFEEAILKITQSGMNPGGEALAIGPFPHNDFPFIVTEYLDVLLSKIALVEVGGPVMRVSTTEGKIELQDLAQ